MKQFGTVAAASLLLAAAGCKTTQPVAPQQPGAPAPSTAKCTGTLGIDAAPLSAAVRKRLNLPKDARGAFVTQVFPGGPAAAAGIKENDIVEKVGPASIGNDCEFARAGFDRACEPVSVTVRRGGETVEATLTPVNEAPFFEKLCAAGNPGACFRQAWLLWSKDHGDGHAFELFESACKAGSGEACAYEGYQLTLSSERSRESVAILDRACDEKSGSGCAHLGFLYATGKDVTKDDKRAAVLYQRSCDLGDAQGCYNAGLMADDGRGVARDAARAAAAYDEACELGSATACTNLGFLYENGRGVKKDRAKALALYQRGCDGSACQPSNLGGCVNVGRSYRDGIGVDKNEEKAAEIFREACERKENPDDIHSAENGSRACSLLGALYLSGEGIPKDVSHGLTLSELGCGRGDSFGCFNAAAVYASGGGGVAEDPAKAAEYLEKACKGGDGEGCHDLAVAYERGNGVSKDARRAKALYQQACELGFTAACKKKTK